MAALGWLLNLDFGATASEAEAPAPTPAAATGGRPGRKPRRFKVEHEGNVFYVDGYDRAEALFNALTELAAKGKKLEKHKIKLKPVRRTKTEMVDDEIGEILRGIEEEEEEDLLATILSSMRIH